MGDFNEVQAALSEPALVTSESDLELEKELQELLESSLGEDLNEKSFDPKNSTLDSSKLKELPDLSSLKLQG